MVYTIKKIGGVLTAQDNTSGSSIKRANTNSELLYNLTLQGTRRPDGRYDFSGNVDLTGLDLTELPQTFFGRVNGNFDCSGNQLTSLRGAPQCVAGSFLCSYNHLSTLEGSPRYISHNLHCEHNPFFSLKGAPRYIGGSVYHTSPFTEKDWRKFSYIREDVYSSADRGVFSKKSYRPIS